MRLLRRICGAWLTTVAAACTSSPTEESMHRPTGDAALSPGRADGGRTENEDARQPAPPDGGATDASVWDERDDGSAPTRDEREESPLRMPLAREDAGPSSRDASASNDLGAGGASAPGDDECELTYSEGHGDVFIALEGDVLRLYVRSAFGESALETLVAFERVCVVVSDASVALTEAMGGAPDAESFEFLGVAPREPFWLLPATPYVGLPWLGASTEGVPPGRYLDEEVRLVLSDLDAPSGAFVSVWGTDVLGGPDPYYATATGLVSHVFSVGAHVHFNWAFSEPGIYDLVFRVEARRASQGDQVSPTARLRFLVGGDAT